MKNWYVWAIAFFMASSLVMQFVSTLAILDLRASRPPTFGEFVDVNKREEETSRMISDKNDTKEQKKEMEKTISEMYQKERTDLIRRQPVVRYSNSN